MTIGVVVADPLTLCPKTVAHRVCCDTDDHAASVTRTQQPVPPVVPGHIGTGSLRLRRSHTGGVSAMTPGSERRMMTARRMSDPS